MDDVAVVRLAARLRGSLSLPGDKSISHRAIMMAALAEGESRVERCSTGLDVRATIAVARALGVSIEQTGEHGITADFLVRSPGADGLVEPSQILDCRNSGTSMRLYAGILASLPFFAVLDGDDSLRGRPVARVVRPLRAMGATLEARRNGSVPPLAVRGRSPLTAIDWTTEVPSAQVKSSILLAGLRAEGRTTVHEAIATRDHTERMLRARGVSVTREDANDGSGAVAWTVEGGRALRALDERVPGDCSAAAFWLVAGAIHPDAELTIESTGVNPTRRAVIDLLRRMGASIEERTIRADDGVGEPAADLVVRSSELRAIEIGPAEVATAIDEIPILCLAAACASGTTVIDGVGELRHKESDRVAGMADGLRAMGVTVRVDGDRMEIDGKARLRGATVETMDDHRLAMTFAVAGLLAEGETTVLRPGSAAVSYPGFFDELERVRA